MPITAPQRVELRILPGAPGEPSAAQIKRHLEQRLAEKIESGNAPDALVKLLAQLQSRPALQEQAPAQTPATWQIHHF